MDRGFPTRADGCDAAGLDAALGCRWPRQPDALGECGQLPAPGRCRHPQPRRCRRRRCVYRRAGKPARLLVITDGWHGATIYMGGASHRIAPRPTSEVDPTGAGDVFATSFLLRLAETGDPFVAARFANVAASISVEASGMDSVPYRARVEEWLEHNP